MTRTQTLSLGLAAVLAAAGLSGCFGDAGGTNTSSATPPAGTAPPVDFSTFVDVTFKEAANSTPTNFDNVTFVYDVNDDPTAFDSLLM